MAHKHHYSLKMPILTILRSAANFQLIVCAFQASHCSDFSWSSAKLSRFNVCEAWVSAYSASLWGPVCLYLLPIYLSRALTKQILVLFHPVCPVQWPAQKALWLPLLFALNFVLCLRTSAPHRKASADFEIIQHNGYHFLSCVGFSLIYIKKIPWARSRRPSSFFQACVFFQEKQLVFLK